MAKIQPGAGFWPQLDKTYGPDPASSDSTATKGAAATSATVSKGAPATASKGAPATASKGVARGTRSVSWQLHGRAVTFERFSEIQIYSVSSSSLDSLYRGP